MRKSGWTPLIVPRGEDQNVYPVMDDLGQQGCVWREADSETADLENTILGVLEGQYKSPVRVVAFNTGRPLVAGRFRRRRQELRRRYDLQ